MRKILALTLMLSVVLAAQYLIWRENAAVTMTEETVAGTNLERYSWVQKPSGVVIVAHGFAGSKEGMRPWGYALARQGFDTYLIEQPGHGSSTRSLPAWLDSRDMGLAENLRAIMDELVRQGRAEPGRIALVGHSMGGSTVTMVALADPRVSSTVAISSAYREVLPPDRPANLLSIVAERDPAFMQLAVRAIATQSNGGQGELGKQYGDFTAGTARLSAVASGRNHLTIIYDEAVIGRAADWIHTGFGTRPPEGASTPVPLPPWVGVALVAALGVVLASGAMLSPASEPRVPSGQPRPGLLTALVTLSVAAFSAVLASVYVRVPGLNLTVIDYLIPYFLVMSLVLWVLRLMWPRDFGFPVSQGQPVLVSMMRGAGVFLGYVGAVGTVIHMNLAHYMPTIPRLLPLILLVVVFGLYFVQEEALKRAVAIHVGQVAAFLAGVVGKFVILATWLGANALPNPPIFLGLIAPVALGLLLTVEIIGFFLNRWRFPVVATATFAALVLAWSVAVIFPLQ